MILYKYKEICKKIRRLPIDSYTMQKLICHCKKEFRTGSKFQGRFHKKTYDKYNSLLDDILHYENWKSLPKVLDFIYKDVEAKRVYVETDSLFKQFKNMNYNELRQRYPSIHLIHELNIPQTYKDTFNRALAKEGDDFMVCDHFKLNPGKLPVVFDVMEEPITKIKQDHLIQELTKFYSFIKKNQSRLTHLKLSPMEVLYPPNKFGQPLHIIQRDKILNQHLKYMKSLVQTFRPILKSSLIKINNLANSNSINPNFFKHLIHKRKLFPHVVLRGNKKFIPDEKNLKKIYKLYLIKQFYIEDSQYHLNPLNNFYS